MTWSSAFRHAAAVAVLGFATLAQAYPDRPAFMKERSQEYLNAAKTLGLAK